MQIWSYFTVRIALAAASLSLFTAGAEAATWESLGEPGSGGWITSVVVSPHDPNRVLIGGDILGVGVSTDGGETWGPSFGFKSWEISSLTFHPTDPNTVWAGTMSGPYRSTDGGVNWEPKRIGMDPVQRFFYSAPIEQVLFDPNNSSRLIAVGGSSRPYPSPGQPEWGAIWESLNGGETWSRLSTLTPTGSAPGSNNGVPGVVIMDAAFAGGSSDTLFATALNNGLYRSTDGGNTWTQSNSGLTHLRAVRVEAHPTDPLTVYASLDSDGTTPGGVFKSSDGGQTWSQPGRNLPAVSGSVERLTSSYEAMTLFADNPDVIYTADKRDNTEASLLRSLDGGRSWQTLLQNGDTPLFDPAGLNTEVIGIDPSNADRVFVGTGAHVLRTEDAGLTWDDVTSDFVGNGPAGPEFRGTGFTGWVATAIEFNPLDPDHLILQGLDAARGIQTKNGGESWVRVMHEERDYEGGRDVAFAGANAIYGTHGRFGVFDGISRSLDGGVTWETLAGAERGLPALGTSQSVPRGIYALPESPNQVWAVVAEQLMHSSNSGDSWSPVSSPALAGETLRWIAEDPANPHTFYISGTDAVFRTTDAGQTFQSIGGPGRAGKMEVDSQGTLYLASHNGNGSPGDGLWSYDGSLWRQLFDDEWVFDVTVDPLDPLRIAVTTGDDIFHDETAATGVYLTLDGGATWQSINDNLPMTRGSVIAFNPHRPEELLYGTSGRGFFAVDLGAPGDFNGDGMVNAADFTVWRDTLNSTTDLRADADLNGVIDLRDYTVWSRNLGRVDSAIEAAASVAIAPEPTSLLLAAAALTPPWRLRARTTTAGSRESDAAPAGA